MKKLIFFAAISALSLSACQKTGLDPIYNSTPILANKTAVGIGTNQQKDTVVNVKSNLRLQLAMDSVNSDNIMICFDPSAKSSYDPSEDAVTFQGWGKVSLSSFSSDNIPLAINKLPLMSGGVNIALKVNTSSNGIYSLTLNELSALPATYKVWLMDNFKKDSLDMGVNHVYAFNVYKSDTTSYGSNRFHLKVRYGY